MVTESDWDKARADEKTRWLPLICHVVIKQQLNYTIFSTVHEQNTQYQKIYFLLMEPDQSVTIQRTGPD